MSQPAAVRSRGFAHLILLALIAIVVIGAAYEASSGDIAYKAQSALAAVVSAFDTTPKIVMTRDAASPPTGTIWPGSPYSLAIFDVASKNVSTTAYIKNLVAGFQVNTSPSSLQRKQFFMQYGYCPSSSGCTYRDIPISSITQSGSTYIVTASNLNLPVYPNQLSKIIVGNTSYYGVAYNLATAKNVAVRATITGQNTAVTSTGASMPVDTTLAYGNYLTVSHGTGYGYGYYDYTNDNSLDRFDVETLLYDISVLKPCGMFKICDLNKDGYVNSKDINQLSQYAQVSTTASLRINTGPSNPAAGQIVVSSSPTTGVRILNLNLTAPAQSVVLSSMPIGISTSDDHLSDVVSAIKLMKGFTVISSKTVDSNSADNIIFDNLNETIAGGTSANYSIVVDLKGNSAYADGTTLRANTTDGTYGWRATDQIGLQVTNSGAALGNSQTFFSVKPGTSLSVTPGTTSTTVQRGTVGQGDVGTFTIPFTLTAGGDDVYISSNIGWQPTPTSMYKSIVNTVTTNLSAANVVPGDSPGSYFKIPANTSRSFRFTLTATVMASGYLGIQLTNINYKLQNSIGLTFIPSNLAAFKTSDVYLVKH